MSVEHATHRTARTELTVQVSRHAPGDLTEGVRERLASLDPVEDVEEFDVHGLRPGLNDLSVEVSARLRVDADTEAAAVSALESGFGVADVSVTFDGDPPP